MEYFQSNHAARGGTDRGRGKGATNYGAGIALKDERGLVTLVLPLRSYANVHTDHHR